jgi:hypothetical protein
MIETLVKITKAETRGGHHLYIRFSDGSEGEHDFAGMVCGEGVLLAPLRDPAYFARFFLEEGALTWPNGLDLDPTALHQEMKALSLLRRSNAAA